MGFLRQEYCSGLPFPFPGDHVLFEISTMIHPSWVVLQSKTHIFIELHKTVILVIICLASASVVLVLEDVKLCFLLLSTLWWMRIRGLCKLPDGSYWLWGKVDLASVGSDSKESTSDAGDLGSIPGFNCLENPMDRGAWWPTVLGVTRSQTQLSD